MTNAPPKKDITAELRLRPEPKPVLRLSRKALTIGGIVAGVSIGGALMLAMVPAAKPRIGPQASDDVKRSLGTERLNQLPKSYADVPVLGPPLPGDFGKPMLNAGIEKFPEITPSNGAIGSGPPQLASPSPRSPTLNDQALQSARVSGVFSGGPLGASQRGSTDTPSAALPVDYASFLPPQATPARSVPERQSNFLRTPTDRGIVSAERLIAPASPYILQAGSVFPAALITGIRSDLPGQVVAQVTQDIYDTLGNGYLLVPQGARLIGEYDNAVAFGQSRVLLAWKRLILPNGKSLILDKLSAADVSGQAGLEDKTDYHWHSMLNAAALSTLLSVGAQSGASDRDDEIVSALRDGASDSINRTGQRIVERQLNIAPTLTIRPGARVRVILARDLVLEPFIP